MAHPRRTYPAWLHRRGWAERADSPEDRTILWIASRDRCARCLSREEQSGAARWLTRGRLNCWVRRSADRQRAPFAQGPGWRTNWRERQRHSHSPHRETRVVHLTRRIAIGVTVSGCNARRAACDFQRFAADTSKAFASEGYVERQGQHRALSLPRFCSSIWAENDEIRPALLSFLTSSILNIK